MSLIRITIAAQHVLSIIENINELAAKVTFTKIPFPPVDVNDIFVAIKTTGIDYVEQMVNELLATSTNLDHELIKKFAVWLNNFVYLPAKIKALDKMVDEGFLEITGMNKKNEFIYKLTEKGKNQQTANSIKNIFN